MFVVRAARFVEFPAEFALGTAPWQREQVTIRGTRRTGWRVARARRLGSCESRGGAVLAPRRIAIPSRHPLQHPLGLTSPTITPPAAPGCLACN